MIGSVSATNGAAATNGRTPTRTPRVAIIGAGMSGIGMGARLRMAGISSFDVYEKRADLGGTWHQNTYPGLSCDVPCRYYSYTFAPNPDWSCVYASGRELWEYFDRVARDFGVRERVSFATEVEEARWVDGHWRLRTKAGHEADYDFIVSACGGINQPKLPDIPDRDSFAGSAFHSAAWDHDVPLAGRRIGVIGTGSTGVQITRALAPIAGAYKLFQRTPQWILPLPNRRYSRISRALMRRFPAVNRLTYDFWRGFMEHSLGTAVVRPGFSRWLLSTACRRHLNTVKDPDLRRRFTPLDQPMCKRLVMATDFYSQFERRGVELVDAAIERIEERGVVTADGTLHELDVLVFATGFNVHVFLRPIELVAPDGARLSELWDGEPWAYKTVALPGFPNFFMLIGPHSPFGNQSLVSIAETQIDYAMRWIELWREGRVDAMTPTRAATDRFNVEVRAKAPTTIWASGCKSWYIGKDGLPHAWPDTPDKHRELLAELQIDEFEVSPGPAVAPRVAV
jgi:cation diffusion facilitator CzcD-associated flavoprotein CzcO